MAPFSPHFTVKQEEQLRTLLRVFLEENAKLNLSAYREPEQCWVGNVLDSVAAVEVIEAIAAAQRQLVAGGKRLASALRMIDVGTGGGFPLLPLAILLPEVQFTGFDATRKKVEAVGRMVDALKLQNVTLLTGRAEELGHPTSPAPARRGWVRGASNPELREQFDVVLCRAVAELATLLEYCSPFARVGGKVIAWKTLSIEEEVEASVTARMQLHCRLMDRVRYDLDELVAHMPAPPLLNEAEGAGHPPSPLAGYGRTGSIFGLAHRAAHSGSSRIHLWGTRQLLIFEKVKTLPREFPRKTGVPKKQPL